MCHSDGNDNKLWFEFDDAVDSLSMSDLQDMACDIYFSLLFFCCKWLIGDMVFVNGDVKLCDVCMCKSRNYIKKLFGTLSDGSMRGVFPSVLFLFCPRIQD